MATNKTAPMPGKSSSNNSLPYSPGTKKHAEGIVKQASKQPSAGGLNIYGKDPHVGSTSNQ